MGDITDILQRHDLGESVVITRLSDNHHLFIDKFTPRTFGNPESLSGRRVSEIPDKKFGRWAEASIIGDLRRNRPRLIACKVPVSTALGDFDVPYTALRLPCGPAADPSHVLIVTRMEPSAYRTAKERATAPEHPPTSPPRKPHLRLVKS